MYLGLPNSLKWALNSVNIYLSNWESPKIKVRLNIKSILIRGLSHSTLWFNYQSRQLFTWFLSANQRPVSRQPSWDRALWLVTSHITSKRHHKPRAIFLLVKNDQRILSKWYFKCNCTFWIVYLIAHNLWFLCIRILCLNHIIYDPSAVSSIWIRNPLRC